MHFRKGKHAAPSKMTRRRMKLALLPVAGAMAIGPIVVHPGDTLSGIAQSLGVSLSSVEAANPQITNPDLIYAGNLVNVPGSSSGPARHATVQHAASNPPAAATSSGSFSTSDLADIPGVPRQFAACVAFRESTNGTNQAYNGGVYGIIRASGINVNGQSLAAQKAAFAKLYAQYGDQPWRPSEGCHS
jgi:LysM repeat protein